MANSRQEYFILRNNVPIANANNFLRTLLGIQEADHVMKGELLVKEALPQESSHLSRSIYSLAWDRHNKVSCSNSDVIALSEDDYEWLAPIRKNVDRWQFYVQGDKFESVKALKVGDNVWVTITAGDGMPYHLSSTSCCHATVQYIGPLQDTPGRWVGVELKEKRGSCDGTFRDSRYFVCDDGYGIFLPASNILTVSQPSSAPPVPTSSTPTLQGPRSTRKKILVSSTISKSDRDFYLDDRVVVFDKDGRRVPGVVKWAVHGKERGVDCYIIGIETDMFIKKEKVEGHISNMGHYFPYMRDFKKHTYLAIPEVSVLKEGEGIPVCARSEAMDHINPPDVTESVRAATSTVAKNTRSTTAAESQPQPTQPIPPHPVSHNLEVGSAVELVDPPGYGIIRWIGKFPGVIEDIAGVELDMKVDGCGDGSWDNKRYFTCKDGHAIFIVLKRLLPDWRVRRGHSAGGDPIVQALQDELATVRKQLFRQEEALQAKNKQNEELRRTIADLRGTLSATEEQLRALQPLWAIPATELEVTETILGKGAYGEVRVGVYHGDRVAVKRLHNVIASDYFHKMIQREMGIAARLRHPKLVLFIGAVTTGNLTIVTELMETSLRSELMHGRLKEDHILSISRDVACALCYLHSLPEPIIHRDVSSANVLLNSTKGGWVAKLGDYGSANFQAKLQTVGPGCPVYAAPEASRPEEQGPKMDVYSYGVLVLELCTGTLPDPRDLPVIQQAVHSWRQPKRQLGGLACQCTLQSSDRRPHMRNVVTQLNGM